MRVGFFGQSGPYAPVALRRLAIGRGAWELAGAVVGRKGAPRTRRHEPRPRDPLPEGEDLEELARSMGLPSIETTDVNGGEARRAIAALELDLIVCVGFDRLFSADLLALARRGGINAHPSKLPQHRGPAPIFWLRKEGRSESAVTVHVLDPKEDHGPILAQEPFVIPPLATGDVIFNGAGELAGRMLHEILDRMAVGKVDAVPQDHSRATRAPRPKPEDAFFEPLAWTCSHLLDFASAAAFYRAAWTRSGDEVFFVRRGLGADFGRKLPGLYLQQGNVLLVQCRDGVAHLEVQV